PIFHKEPAQRSERERFFHDFLVHYTNAATLISEDFKDTEDGDFAGLFSGFDKAKRQYDVKKWRYDSEKTDEKQDGGSGTPGQGQPHSFSAQVGKLVGPRPREDATLQNPRCVFQILRKHYNRQPGYRNTPTAQKKHDTPADYINLETQATSYWSNFPKFIVSQLKAWYGDAATAANDYAYDFLPKNIGDHSHIPMFVEMSKGTIKGFFAMGQNPAVGGQNASFQRQALAKLDWMVVRDLYETETASFWKDSPEVKSGKLKTQDIKTEVFFLPAAAVAEMDGSFTNTQRLVQWHDKAVDPSEDCRSDIWFTVHLGL